MRKNITVIPGDGIGPEVTEAVLDVLSGGRGGARLRLSGRRRGGHRDPRKSAPPGDERLDRAEPGGAEGPAGYALRVRLPLRERRDPEAVRPLRERAAGPHHPPWSGRYEDIDLVLIRENTEGLYVGVEHFIGMDRDPRAAAESVMITTRYGCERIVRFAFDYAVANGRGKVTLAHKANILKHTQGLFLDVGRHMAAGYEGRVAFEDGIIDATAMFLVLDPYRFDVLVMENMFGDILSDLMAGLVGGLGFAPAGNIGETHAVFEAVHGSAPDIAGQGVANPTGLLLSACLLLNHVGQAETASPYQGGARGGDPGRDGSHARHGRPRRDGGVHPRGDRGAGVNGPGRDGAADSGWLA